MSNALQGLATGNRKGKPELREQQIHTPQCVLDICIKLWGEIHLDPCASPAREQFASECYYADGLTRPWSNCCFVNPPYKNLKDWLAKSEQEDGLEIHEQILLFPVRPNRKWWCQYMSPYQGPITAVAWLKPLKFEGYKQAFPTPLVLVYTGVETQDFESLAKDISCHIGGLG